MPARITKYMLRLAYCVSGIILLTVVLWALTGASPYTSTAPRPGSSGDHDMGFDEPRLAGPSIVNPCLGPHGEIIIDLEGDVFSHEAFDRPTPQPYAGSYADLHLNQTWLTADSRFGPYGRGEDSTDLKWAGVDWAALQNECTRRNGLRFPNQELIIEATTKLQYPTSRDKAWSHWLRPSSLPRRKRSNGRTAIVLRAWSSFTFTEEDIWHMRALITETALASGGDYGVHVLMELKEEHTFGQADCFLREDVYHHLLDTLVPSEFRNITVLFNNDLLYRWYPKTVEHKAEFQMFQPLQLFAQLYPNYDFYWHMEMDVRFTGHAGSLLTAISNFSRAEPRKQARQRASYAFLPATYNHYNEFMQSIDRVLDGNDPYYTGVHITDILDPIGGVPPSEQPQRDHFFWGVGEDADFITFSPVNNASVHKAWMYHYWTRNFRFGRSTPGRIIAPVTTQRASWNLLTAIHDAQVNNGLAVQSESTLASFTLWHGMKISVPPLPIYSRRDHLHSADELNRYINGGPPDAAHHGMAWGEWVHDRDGPEYHQTDTTLHDDIEPTWRFITPYPGDLWLAWTQGLPEEMLYQEGGQETGKSRKDVLPTLMVQDGRIYLPNTIFHPVKTNKDPIDNKPS